MWQLLLAITLHSQHPSVYKNLAPCLQLLVLSTMNERIAAANSFWPLPSDSPSGGRIWMGMSFSSTRIVCGSQSTDFAVSMKVWPHDVRASAIGVTWRLSRESA